MRVVLLKQFFPVLWIPLGQCFPLETELRRLIRNLLQGPWFIPSSLFVLRIDRLGLLACFSVSFPRVLCLKSSRKRLNYVVSSSPLLILCKTYPNLAHLSSNQFGHFFVKTYPIWTWLGSQSTHVRSRSDNKLSHVISIRKNLRIISRISKSWIGDLS